MTGSVTFDRRQPTTRERHSTFDDRLSDVGCCFAAVGCRLSNVVAIAMLCISCCFADDAISPAFTFDARYQASGVTPDAWVAYQAEGLSGRFATATVTRTVDENGNGIPDEWETAYGLAGADTAADADPDGDGRTNLEEYNAGTDPIIANDWNQSIAESADPFEADTRVAYIGGNPTFDTTFAVIKVSNGFVCDTGGLYYDWDGDGIPNWWEARFACNGSKTGLMANSDDDADGMSNYAEFVAYTDPTNSILRFVIGLEHIVVAPVQAKKTVLGPLLKSAESVSAFSLQWQSALGRTYSVYVSYDLSKGWETEPVAELAGTGDRLEYRPSENQPIMLFKVSVRLSDDY